MGFSNEEEKELKASSSSPSAGAKSVQWGRRSCPTARCPSQCGYLAPRRPLLALTTEPEPERCPLAPPPPLARLLPTIRSVTQAVSR